MPSSRSRRASRPTRSAFFTGASQIPASLLTSAWKPDEVAVGDRERRRDRRPRPPPSARFRAPRRPGRPRRLTPRCAVGRLRRAAAAAAAARRRRAAGDLARELLLVGGDDAVEVEEEHEALADLADAEEEVDLHLRAERGGRLDVVGAELDHLLDRVGHDADHRRRRRRAAPRR